MLDPFQVDSQQHVSQNNSSEAQKKTTQLKVVTKVEEITSTQTPI